MSEPRKVLERIAKDPDLLAGACHTGLALMLRSSYMPVLPRVLVREGILPEEWFKEVQRLSGALAADLVRRMGMNPERGKKALERESLPSEEAGRVEGRIPAIVGWEEVVEEAGKNQELLKKLGLAWYLWSLVGDEEDFVELFPDLEEVGEMLEELVGRLKRIRVEREGEEESSVIEWENVFRIPI